MVPTSTLLSVVLTAFVSLVLPVLLLVIFAVKYRKQGILSAWLLGAAGFFVTQILIRSPILSVISGQAWFIRFSQEHLFLYTFALAFTAGLFELAGRYAAAKIMEKKLTCRRAMAAGLGHGGIEAMVIVGMTYINNLIYILMINSGSFDAMIAQSAAAGVGPELLEAIRTALLATSPVMFLLAGLERILTMIGQLAMSMLVCWGVHTGKTGKYLLLCLILHTCIDLTAGLSLLAGTALSLTAAYAIIYAILAAVAAVSVFIIRDLCRRWKEQEVPYV